MGKKEILFSVMIGVCLSLMVADSVAESHLWQKLDDGLYLGAFDPKKKSKIYDGKIIILKIDPKIYLFRLLSATEHGYRSRTAKEWCDEFGLSALMNAGMYQSANLLKSTGYMKNYEHFNNPRINKSYGSFMLFNPIDSSLPEVQIIDRRLQKNWKNLIKRYHSVVQNYRMISKGKKRGWPQQEMVYSTAAIGMDRDGNVLFILSRPPYSTHNFIHILLSLPIDIKNAMYVEGGPEATLYLGKNGRGLKLEGTGGTAFTRHLRNQPGFKIPNVIGIVKRR